MILVLCIGNMLFYIHMIKTKCIPLWLSVWGFVGVLSAATASLLVLFGRVEIITSEYLVLNIPTALVELILAIDIKPISIFHSIWYFMISSARFMWVFIEGSPCFWTKGSPFCPLTGSCFICPLFCSLLPP